MNHLKTSALYQRLKQASCGSQAALRPLDLHIGLFLAQLEPSQPLPLLAAAVQASAAVANGHACLPLTVLRENTALIEDTDLPDGLDWAQILLTSGLVGQPGEITPLILDPQQRLYLYRYYQYETHIADNLLLRARSRLNVDLDVARQKLIELAPQDQLDQYQKIAAALTLLRGLVIISGGPGTGKTHTLAYTLALIQALQIHAGDAPLKIALAAPTGKAAARMKESIRNAKENMPAHFSQNVPDDAQTLHRLLGLRPGADDFRYNENKLLNIDMLVVDEASMIDMVMMDGLLRALPQNCRLVLMGDHHQLPSIEAGSLFADLCADTRPDTGYSPELAQDLLQLFDKEKIPIGKAELSPISDTIAPLLINHRQKQAPELARLAQAVNSGSVTDVLAVLNSSHHSIKLCDTAAEKRQQWLSEQILKHYHGILTASSLEAAFRQMESFRFLCAVREGPMSVEGINQQAEALLRQEHLISDSGDFYQGKPIIIRHNQHRMQLYNGDTGILWKDQNGVLSAWFRNRDGALINYAIARLPRYETAYAITVHQAQGSEFRQVILVMPYEENRVLSRELLYTGVTRAKEALSLCGDAAIIEFALRQQTIRYSGLHTRLTAARELESA